MHPVIRGQRKNLKMSHRYNEAEIQDSSTKKESNQYGCFCCSKTRTMVITVSLLSMLVIGTTVPVVVFTARQNDHESQNQPLRVGAFNIKHFGKSKIGNLKLAQNISSVLQRYDIVLIIEVKDVSQTSIINLLEIMQMANKDWRFAASNRLGRTSYKEQYVFYYKSNLISIEDFYQVPDPEDIFEREPYAIKIKYKSVASGKQEQIALAAIHIRPSDAFSELKALPWAVENISHAFMDINGVVMMGDYNAACSYLRKKDQNSLPIFSSDEYKNLISHTADTTVGASDCAYDRITIYGQTIITGAAQVYRFDKFLNLTLTDSLKISDHYPVEFLLY